MSWRDEAAARLDFFINSAESGIHIARWGTRRLIKDVCRAVVADQVQDLRRVRGVAAKKERGIV